MKRFTNAFLASRPFLWVNTAFPFLAGWLVVNPTFSWVLLIGFLYFLFPYNLALYGINDIFDYESDIRNPRKASVEGALLQKDELTKLWPQILAWNIPFIIFLYAVGTVASVAVLTFSLFALAAYSVAGLRFKEIPIIDSITSSLHFVTPLLFGIVVHGGFVRSYLPAIIAFFLWGMASHAFGAIQDIPYDRQGDIKSVATVFGARATVWFSSVLYLLSAFITTIAYNNPAGWIVALVLVCFALNTIRFSTLTDETAPQAHNGWRVFMALSLALGALLTTGFLYTYLPAHNPGMYYPNYLPVVISVLTYIVSFALLRKD